MAMVGAKYGTYTQVQQWLHHRCETVTETYFGVYCTCLFVIACNSEWVLHSDSLMEQIDFCSDKYNQHSENVRCLAVISGPALA